MAQSAKEFLTNTSISSFLNSIEHVISIQANEKAVEALGKILENKISALPVRNADSHNFGSFIDTLDICTFIMQTIDACGDDLDKAEKLFLETTCSQVANRGEKTLFIKSFILTISRLVSLKWLLCQISTDYLYLIFEEISSEFSHSQPL